MTPPDNSDDMILILADWHEDQGHQDRADELRSELADPIVPQSKWDTCGCSIGVGIVGSGVGSIGGGGGVGSSIGGVGSGGGVGGGGVGGVGGV